MKKHFFIPLAALALLAGGATAFASGNDILSKLNINLTTTEAAALEEAREIRASAHEAVEKVLTDAGITDERMKEIHGAMHEARSKSHEAIKTAIETNDYTAFVTAVADTPMAQSINSAEKFAKLVEAQTLREAGDNTQAQAIMEELGVGGRDMGGKSMGAPRGGERPNFDN